MLKEILKFTENCEDTLTVADAVEVLRASVMLMHSNKSVMTQMEKLVGAVIMNDFMTSLMATLCMNFYVVANKLEPDKVKEFAEKFKAEVEQVNLPPRDKGGHYDA